MLERCKVQEQVRQGEAFKESWGSLVQVSVGPQQGPSAFLSSWWPFLQAAPLTGVIRLCQRLGHVAWVHSSKCEQDVWQHLMESEFVLRWKETFGFPLFVDSSLTGWGSRFSSKVKNVFQPQRNAFWLYLVFLLVAIHCELLKRIRSVLFVCSFKSHKQCV